MLTPMHNQIGERNWNRKYSSKSFESLIQAQTLLSSPLQAPELELIWNGEKAEKEK
jgi:hypothetical protein